MFIGPYFKEIKKRIKDKVSALTSKAISNNFLLTGNEFCFPLRHPYIIFNDFYHVRIMVNFTIHR